MDRQKELQLGLEKAALKYVDDIPLRASIQAIPYIGGSLDMLLSGRGQQIQKQRIDRLLHELDMRLKKIEGRMDIPPEDDFYDFMVGVFDGVVRAKTQKKISRFAALVINQLVRPQPWNQADTATRILKELEDIHIEILKTAINAPISDPPFNGLRTITPFKPPVEYIGSKAKPLSEQFPEFPETEIYLSCSELVSRGLLYDEGVGRLSTKAMQYFVATTSGEWLVEYIKDNA